MSIEAYLKKEVYGSSSSFQAKIMVRYKKFSSYIILFSLTAPGAAIVNTKILQSIPSTGVFVICK
jgi:hypothetical protein